MSDLCSELEINMFEQVCMLGEMPSIILLKLTNICKVLRTVYGTGRYC